MAAAFAKRLLDAFVDAGLDRQQCDFDEAAGQMIINNDITRVVPIATLFAQYSLCADEAARSKLVDGAMKAFVEGAADVPSSIAETGDRLLPQLWNKQKIAARQMTLPAGFELPHCGLRGELPLDGDLGVVLVCDYGVDGLSIETPVLSKDLSRWGCLANLSQEFCCMLVLDPVGDKQRLLQNILEQRIRLGIINGDVDLSKA
ncbi:unnamed protein product [Cladocopium goreaui]|uniref:Cns1/TTC4 wheel domain-containing protein n=1 Tax=Cladocopium goreaui TaxID=2562237 RepID=A0A9P1FWI0_9DINO|nr:unnamed protein product [Cladocopium goreaui]CAI3996910.1 unnamed protein product [Cladocopium goreaui]